MTHSGRPTAIPPSIVVVAAATAATAIAVPKIYSSRAKGRAVRMAARGTSWAPKSRHHQHNKKVNAQISIVPGACFWRTQ
jgi:hypothetical protein